MRRLVQLKYIYKGYGHGLHLGLQCGTLAVAGMGFREWVTVAEDLSFRFMELWLDRDNFWPPTTSKMQRAEALQTLSTTNIKVTSICPLPFEPGSWGDFRFEFNLAHVDENLRRKAVEFYKQSVDSAVDFGADTMLTLPGKIDEPDLMKSPHSYRQHLEKLVESLKELSSYARDRGVVIGVEHAVVGNFIDLPWELRYVVNSVNSDNIRVYFDTANANVFLPPIKYLDVVGDLLCKTVHMSDNNGDKPEHLPIGMGNIDFKGVVEKLRSLGWNGYILPEIFYNADPVGGLRRCKRMLEEII